MLVAKNQIKAHKNVKCFNTKIYYNKRIDENNTFIFIFCFHYYARKYKYYKKGKVVFPFRTIFFQYLFAKAEKMKGEKFYRGISLFWVLI